MCIRDRGDFDDALAELEPVVALALELDETKMASRALGHVAHVHYRRGELARAEELLEQAIALARSVVDQRAMMRHTGNLGSVALLRSDDTELAMARFEEATRLASALGDREREAFWGGQKGLALAARGHLRAARVLIERAISELDLLKHSRDAMQWRVQLSRLLLDLADVTAAREELTRCRVLAERASEKFQLQFASGLLGVLESRVGNSVRARELILAALSSAQAMGASVMTSGWRAAYADLEIELGETNDALASIARALDELPEDGMSSARASLYILRGRALLGSNRGEDARAPLRRALELLEGSQKVGPLAELLIWRAELGARLGELETARQWWARARELCEPEELPLKHALALTLEAGALARAGLHDSARALSRRAADVLSPLGLTMNAPSLRRLASISAIIEG